MHGRRTRGGVGHLPRRREVRESAREVGALPAKDASAIRHRSARPPRGETLHDDESAIELRSNGEHRMPNAHSGTASYGGATPNDTAAAGDGEAPRIVVTTAGSRRRDAAWPRNRRQLPAARRRNRRQITTPHDSAPPAHDDAFPTTANNCTALQSRTFFELGRIPLPRPSFIDAFPS